MTSRNKPSQVGRVAITGAASGLGLALARHYAKQGWWVALADIQDEAGEQARAELGRPENEVFYQHVDVTRINDFQAWRKSIEQRWGGLDLLINNAGVATHGAVEDAPLEDWEWVLNINLMGVVRGCRTFIPLFRQQQQGQIVNIASMAGLVHSPEMGSYNASKAGVVAVSETLLGELAPSHVRVSVVCPGFFPTGLAKTARTTHPQVKQAIEKLFQTSRLNADDIAAIIAREAASGTFYILPHFNYRLAWWLKRYVPSAYLRSMQSLGKQIAQRKQRWQNDLMKAANGRPS